MKEENIILEINIKEHSYKLECSTNSPLGELFDALTQFRAYVINKMIESNEPTIPKE